MAEQKTKVGLLGFSADPPHNGHLEMARRILRKNMVDEVWLIPCLRHSFGKPMAPPKDRWRMAKFLEEPGIKASNVEIGRQSISFAVDTAEILKNKYPRYQFFWVMGSDIAKLVSYKSWRDWERLAFLVDFLVIQRTGFEMEEVPPGFILISEKVSDISSSEIRERIRRGLPIDRLVPPKIQKYLEKHNLYKK